MLGNTSDFAALATKEVLQVIVTHCFLHQYSLASKTLPAVQKEILSTSVNIVIFFYQNKGFEPTHFKRFYQEMGAEYEVYHRGSLAFLGTNLRVTG